MKNILFFLFFAVIFCDHKTFVGCEGNFYQSNGSLWTIEGQEVWEFDGNPLGEIVQSLYVHENNLYVTVNGSHSIYVFDITDSGLIQRQLIDTNFSSPREMLVYNNYLYVSNWYSADIKKIDINLWEIVNEISMPGLPEDILLHDGKLYASITMNYDWTDGDKVVVINPETDSIIETYTVGTGPGDLLVHDDEIYISRTYYDENWNAFYGTSKIDRNGDVLMANYGAGTACGGSVLSYNDAVYRVFDGGIARIDEDLMIMPETRIGDFNAADVYAVDVYDDYIYFGLTDFSSPDQVVVVDNNGNIVNELNVGVAPGDFAFWEACIANGDINNDNQLNVADIVLAVSHIIGSSMNYDCSIDLNNDNTINVVDIVMMVQEILNIDSFRGAVNWLDKHIPEFKAKDRLKKIHSLNSKS
tara:strand:+ start:921 stop:2165 length:1245 start_codon:yes stop_codon:yes gene_type:complete